MANLRKNINRKRSLAKRENVAIRTGSPEQNPALKNVTVRAGKGLNKTIEEIKHLRTKYNAENPNNQLSKPTSLYHKYGKNSVRAIKVV